MSYIASNGGACIGWQPTGYVLQAGEKDMGGSYPTLAQIQVQFPAYVPPAPPNPNGFAQAVKAGMGGIIASNALAAKYPLFFPAVTQCMWADVQALIIDANTTLVINATQYAAIKSAAAANNIPITLP